MANYAIIKISIKITYNTYNTRINLNINIYTIINKNCTLLYICRIIRENATSTIIVKLKMGIYSKVVH